MNDGTSLEVSFTGADGKAYTPKATVTMDEITGSLTATGVVEPRELHLLTGTVVKSSEITKKMLKDITAVTVTTDGTGEDAQIENVPLKTQGNGADTSVLWNLQQKVGEAEWQDVSETPDENGVDGWTKALQTYTEGTTYRMTAEVNLTDYNAGTGVTQLDYQENNGKLLAIVPIELYNSKDETAATTNFPLQLKAGNSDLYNHGSESQPQAERARRGTEIFEHKNDLVFYYVAESYDVNVKPYVNANSIEKIGATTGADLATWLTDNAGKVEVEQTTDTGAEISTKDLHRIDADGNDGELVTVIEPSYSDRTANKAQDYFLVNVANSTKRFEEDYRITYQVLDGTKMYYAVRKVRLRYRPGDTDVNGTLESTDADVCKRAANNAIILFRSDSSTDPDDVAKMTKLNNYMIDYDGNATGESTDADDMKREANNARSAAALRY